MFARILTTQLSFRSIQKSYRVQRQFFARLERGFCSSARAEAPGSPAPVTATATATATVPTLTHANPKKKGARIRQHVNPMSAMYQVPVPLADDWVSTTFEHPSRDFVWCLRTAASEAGQGSNFLGLDIRHPVVNEALRRKENSGLRNVQLLVSNANIDIRRLVTSISRHARVRMLCIHHPDPHFKLRNKKRSVVTAAFVRDVAEAAQEGCLLYLQSDVLDVVQDMAAEVASHEAFEAAEGYSASCLDTNPALHAVQTEREVAVLARGGGIYRMLYVRR
jgi:tRNA (guanine-N7-)-methyltransferase